MGRSSAEQAHRNRERIVEGASGLFRARGIENVSVAEIMASVGMTTGGFYKHFGSKDALVNEACAASFAQAQRSWENVAVAADGPTMAAIVKRYFQARPPEQTCPMLAYALDAAADRPASPLRDIYTRGVEKLFERFAGRPPNRQGVTKTEEEAAVLFAAMLGAKLLEQATDDAEWARLLLTAVFRKAPDEL